MRAIINLAGDIGLVSGGPEAGVIVSDQICDVFERVDAVIDFTIPAATVEFAKAAAETGTPHIIGTTGFTPEDIQEIEASAQKTAIVRAGNIVAWGQPFGQTDPPSCGYAGC